MTEPGERLGGWLSDELLAARLGLREFGPGKLADGIGGRPAVVEAAGVGGAAAWVPVEGVAEGEDSTLTVPAVVGTPGSVPAATDDAGLPDVDPALDGMAPLAALSEADSEAPGICTVAVVAGGVVSPALEQAAKASGTASTPASQGEVPRR